MATRDDAAERTDRADTATIAHLADELLPLLIARLGASGLGELEVRQDGWRVRLRRSLNGEAAGAHPSAGATTGHRSAPRQADRRGDAPHAEGQSEQARRERGRVAITSPAVGYYQPRDGLAAGMSVRGGDLLGHVDVLGVRQQVVAPQDGILAALSAEAGEAVEYGQTLARLEPEGRG
jgi:biotin carboxyl carrier protein